MDKPGCRVEFWRGKYFVPGEPDDNTHPGDLDDDDIGEEPEEEEADEPTDPR